LITLAAATYVMSYRFAGRGGATISFDQSPLTVSLQSTGNAQAQKLVYTKKLTNPNATHTISVRNDRSISLEVDVFMWLVPCATCWVTDGQNQSNTTRRTSSRCHYLSCPQRSSCYWTECRSYCRSNGSCVHSTLDVRRGVPLVPSQATDTIERPRTALTTTNLLVIASPCGTRSRYSSTNNITNTTTYGVC